ncbi:DUF305 domain-containing protein [Brevundimonas sp. UBA2416]|uniref:DUF305 domain-containing protein n=1 Tax=Brevundimonas sp. UBA2416 TaxID=1946124 RepID=UPI0025C336FC|nr:DUF305 domain-containing protein [Brevundimonas sp. UBA2416]HRJ63480.1 DUF305 domain-containing protein [Brevundimonas sp.]
MRLAPIALTALALTLSACEGGGDPVQQALRDASAENHAETVQEGVVSAPAHAGGHGATPGDQAFAASEAEMHAGMARASGSTVDEAYIAKMIEHHRGAVAMAEVALRESRDPEVRRMAQVVVDTQTREIAEMRAWKPATSPPRASN